MTPGEFLEILEQRVTQAMRDEPELWEGLGDGYNRAQKIGLWPVGEESVASLVVGRIQHPETLGEDQMIVKVLDTRCDPGGLFLKAIADGVLLGDHFVEVLAYSHIGHVGIYIMEKLEPLPRGDYCEVMDYVPIADEAQDWLNQANEVLGGYSNRIQDVVDLREWAEEVLPYQCSDLHNGNAMMRGDTYVIIDPYGPYDDDTTSELHEQEAPLPSGRTGDSLRLCA